MNKKSLTWIKGLVFPFLAIALYLTYLWMGKNVLVDQFFTQGLSKNILKGISGFSALIPYSIAEFMAVAMIIQLIVLVVKLMVNLFNRKNILESFFRLLNTVSLLVIGFLLIWGFNYRALGVEASIGLKPVQGTAAELEELAAKLAKQAGQERALAVVEDEIFDYRKDIHKASKLAYHEMGKIYPEFINPVGRAKPLLSSRIFSKMGISGIFFPYTGEANYNADQHALLVPAVILHELAHLKGIAREEEANFIAYLVSRYSEDPALRYSATMLALINTQNRLFQMDGEAAGRVHSLYNAGMKWDLSEHNQYWIAFEGPVRERAEQVNDSYLKHNGQSQGTKSYQDMVSYLLAYYNGKLN